MKNFAPHVALVFVAIAAAACGPAGDTTVEEEAPVDDQGSMADRAIGTLQERYDQLTETDMNAPVDWAAEDLENIGDWEYKILELEKLPAEELEALLNELGNDRWEVIWIDKTLSGLTIYLKKPSISLISKLPLSQLGRLLMKSEQ